MNLSNSTSSYEDSYEYNDTEEGLIKMCEADDYKMTTAVCYAIVFCLSILGNGFLIFALTCFEDLKRATNLFMFCLSLFDLLFTLTLPFWCVEFLHHWIFGDVACKIMTGAYFVGIYGSLILLTAMTIDRFVVVVVRSYWLTRSRRLKCSKAACVGAWIISLIACLRDSVTSKAQIEHITYACKSTNTEDDEVGYYSQLILLFLVPFAIIVFCYTKIILTLMSTSSRQKHRTVILVLCIVLAFFICWGPYHIIIVLMSAYEFDACVNDQLHIAFIVSRILAFSHCCINPALYILRGKYRNLLSSFLFCSPELRQSYRGPTDPSDSRIHPYMIEERLENCEMRQTNATELNTS